MKATGSVIELQNVCCRAENARLSNLMRSRGREKYIVELELGNEVHSIFEQCWLAVQCPSGSSGCDRNGGHR